MANDQPGAGTAGAAWVAPLLERQQEVSVLGDLVGRASAGTAGIAVVQGEAGIGKSRLLAATRAEAARAGLWVLAARGSELEHAFPFGVVRQLFEPALRDRRRPALTGAAARAATVLGPAEDAGPPPADPSFASLHGLYWLTAHLSEERPHTQCEGAQRGPRGVQHVRRAGGGPIVGSLYRGYPAGLPPRTRCGPFRPGASPTSPPSS